MIDSEDARKCNLIEKTVNQTVNKEINVLFIAKISSQYKIIAIVSPRSIEQLGEALATKHYQKILTHF